MLEELTGRGALAARARPPARGGRAGDRFNCSGSIAQVQLLRFRIEPADRIDRADVIDRANVIDRADSV